MSIADGLVVAVGFVAGVVALLRAVACTHTHRGAVDSASEKCEKSKSPAPVAVQSLLPDSQTSVLKSLFERSRALTREVEEQRVSGASGCVVYCLTL